MQILVSSDTRVESMDVFFANNQCFHLNGFQLNSNSLNNYLQKMKSIKYLIVNSFDSFESIHNRELLLQLMINKCLNIESIKMDFYLIRDELLVLFGHKFGSI